MGRMHRRNPSARDPSPVAQHGMSGVPGRFAAARRGRAPALRVRRWGPGALVWVHRLACTVGRGSCPRRPLSGSHAPPSKRTALPSLSLRTSAHAGVAIRSPASRKACAPRQGRNGGRAIDRPDGRCNAFALLRNGLPRRCAPRNDGFEGLVGLDGTARQICRCPAGASPRPTGARPGPGALGRGCRANLLLPCAAPLERGVLQVYPSM